MVIIFYKIEYLLRNVYLNIERTVIFFIIMAYQKLNNA